MKVIVGIAIMIVSLAIAFRHIPKNRSTTFKEFLTIYACAFLAGGGMVVAYIGMHE